MASTSKQEPRELIDRLDDEEARRLSTALRGTGAGPVLAHPRLLTEDDVILTEPLLPDDETADELITAIRRWRVTRREAFTAECLGRQPALSIVPRSWPFGKERGRVEQQEVVTARGGLPECRSKARPAREYPERRVYQRELSGLAFKAS